MHSVSKINALRLEKKLSQKRLDTLKNNLNTGTFNTRKYQSDTQKIQRLKDRIDEINTTIHVETNKLGKLKTSQINISKTPFLKNMFVTPPKNRLSAQPTDNPLDRTIETQVSQTETSHSTDETGIFKNPIQTQTSRATQYPYIEDITDEDLPKSLAQRNDFQHFIENTVGLGNKPLGAIQKIPQKLNFVTSEQLTNVLSEPITLKPLPTQFKTTQVHKTPITTELPRKTTTFSNDFCTLRPPISQPSLPKQLSFDNPIFQGELSKPTLPQFQADISGQPPNNYQPSMTRPFPVITQPRNPNNLNQINFSNMESVNAEGIVSQPRTMHSQQNIQDNQRFVQNQNLDYSHQQHQQNLIPQNFQNQEQNNPIFRGQNFNDQAFVQNQNQRVKPRDTFLRRLRCIPKFNGDSYAQLKEFTDVVESLYVSCTNESEENELYEQLLLQVRGEPRNILMALDNPNWPTIRAKLMKNFAYLANKEILTTQLENVRQYKDEPLNAYAERVRNLLRDKNATYSFMTEEQKLEHNRLARRSFTRGVSNPKLRNCLTTRGPSSLEDAIAHAIEAENDDINYIPNADLYCRKCNMNGHRQRECNRQNNDSSEIGKLIAALRSIGGQNRPTSQNRNFMPNNNNANNPNFFRNLNNSRNRDWNQNQSKPNWNFNPNSQIQNFNNGPQNRSWNQNNNYPNRNWDQNNNYSNRNWNQNYNYPNRNSNQNWTPNSNLQNRNWNSNENSQNQEWNQERNWNQNSNSNTNRENNFNRNGNNANRNQNNQPRPANRALNNGQNRPSQDNYNRQMNELTRQANNSNLSQIAEAGASSSTSSTNSVN